MKRKTSMRAAGSTFYGCRCFFNKNYYVADYDIHVEYSNDAKIFLQDYEKLLKEKGCSRKNLEVVLHHLDHEHKRRISSLEDSEKRVKEIKASYSPLHSGIYSLKESYFKPGFLDLVQYVKRDNTDHEVLMSMLVREKADRVFRMPVFTEEFCQMFLEEMEHFERSDCPKGRPNTMNHEGILLDELGFNEGFLTPLREDYLDPLAKVLFPEWGGGRLDSHKAFTVKYAVERDADLGFHYDNAEVTLNISLSDGFDDGSLYFGKMRQDGPCDPMRYVEVKHALTEGVLHRGQHRHGAMPITDGERTNLIIWMRASSVRNKLCPMCNEEPSLFPMTGFGGGFTKQKDETDVQMCALY